MEQINPMVKETVAYTYQASGIPTQDQGLHFERVYEWLSQTPFAPLLTAMRSGTKEDQLQCMLQVERWLLRCHPAAIFGRYTRNQFFEDVQRISSLYGLTPGSSLLRAYRRKTPRSMLLQSCLPSVSFVQ